MTDPDGIALMMGVLFLLGIFLVMAAGVEWMVSKPRRRRFVQRDKVAERKRVILRNAFKTRAGIR